MVVLTAGFFMAWFDSSVDMVMVPSSPDSETHEMARSIIFDVLSVPKNQTATACPVG